VTVVDAVQECPDCGSTALARLRTDPPWCTKCKWNLAQWPEPKKKRGRRGIARDRKRAFELNRRLLAELEGAQPSRPRRTRAAALLAGASAALLVFDLALLLGGVYLLINAIVPLKILAVFMILVAVECRIRFDRVGDRWDGVSRQELPGLWSVIDEAQVALGAPRVDTLIITNEFNASCARSGIRRRVVLTIGLPLWGVLSADARQALLGHELGHLVNGDPTTAFATQPALNTFASLAEIFDPRDMIDSQNAVAEFFGTLLAYAVFLPLHLVCNWAQTALIRVAAQDHQRAEVYADALSVKLGGTAGATELTQVLLFETGVLDALRRSAAASDDPQIWRAAVGEATAACAAHARVAEQRSMRYGVSRYRSHPPDGLRSRLVRSWPRADPAIPVPAEKLATADRELARQYKSAQRAIGHWRV
jgi:heat shock protein HtpX